MGVGWLDSHDFQLNLVQFLGLLKFLPALSVALLTKKNNSSHCSMGGTLFVWGGIKGSRAKYQRTWYMP